ncbi:type I polyketide synthase [Ectobacillus funiculus]|uniref:type I polyketide synthase n=1 Tax=Ectobacillus funiculus TaxID=137993 RepID=UPI00101D0269|nr:type I polyketide synthase [Ectobacillus funiculus]
MNQYGKEIAVVGLGCVLPDAFTPQQFWENNRKGHTSLRSLNVHHRWNWEVFHDSDPDAVDKTYTITAGAIENYEFDWKKFRIPPSEVQASSPMQFMILDAGAQALEGVRLLPTDRTGIYIGSIGSGWQKDTGLQIHRDVMLEALKMSSSFLSLPNNIQEKVIGSIKHSIGKSLNSAGVENLIVHSLASVACGRIAQYFDIKGPHVAVDAGYASSLAALEIGIRSLQEGSVDLSLVGGASEILTPLNMIAFSKLGGLSKSIIRPLDGEADGTLLGEGTAMFALKRLEDAVRDEEHIYAVIKGIGSSSDGSGRSLLAPDHQGQALAMKRAYEDAHVDPKTISYIECHATGTQLGDVSEVKALSSFHEEASYRIILGSVKANIGHLGAAAGAAGLLRTILTLYHGLIPPQVSFHTSNLQMQLASTPFTVPLQPIALQPQDGTFLPRAGISSFAFGGINYHAVLEAYSSQYTACKTGVYSDFEEEPIAIIGMSGIFPDAADKETFWSNLLQGKDSVTEIPDERFDSELFYDSSRAVPEKSYTKLGGFLSHTERDPLKWRIPPSSAPYIDEAHQLALTCVEQALQNAGYDPNIWDGEQVSVMLGFLPYQTKKLLADVRVNYQEIRNIFARVLEEQEYIISPALQRCILDEAEQCFMDQRPKITEDTLAGYLGSLAAGRVAKHFNFKGTQLAIDGACCSTHLAFLAAVQSLRHKKSDVVLVGGINADMTPEFYVGGCGIQALSADGIRPFDARADGFVPGEGAGFFVLRRLSDAKRDGQNILTLIRSVAATSDGKSGSILSPSLEGEASAMVQALRQARVSPEQVDYVECHGTGTVMGDATEIEALLKAYGTDRTKPLQIGSVKSNIGHLLAAAAVPAVMKTVFALREGVIPPSINIEVVNPKLNSTREIIQVVTSCERWETEYHEPRRAGVSGFGLGGANSHMILEEYKVTEQQFDSFLSHETSQCSNVLPIAVTQGASLSDCALSLLQAAQTLEEQPDEKYLLVIRRMQQAVPPMHPGLYRVAIVANNSRELLRKTRLLVTAISKGINLNFLRQQGIFTAEIDPNLKVAVVFPGQGSQYPNMLREALEHFPLAAEFMAQVDEEYQVLCGRTLSSTFFTERSKDFQQTDEDIHCAVFAINCAMFTLLRAYGLEFDAAIGQSAGELAAFVAAEALSLRDALRVVRERTLSVLSLSTEDAGKMLTVYCSAMEAREYFKEVSGYCDISADNSPRMCIVSGETEAIRALRGIYEKAGIQTELLPVSHGYHSLLISHAKKPYRSALDTCTFYQPVYDIISTITGSSLRYLRVDDYPALLESQFVEPVRLQQAVENAHEAGMQLFIECGPKWAISTFISEILEGKDFYVQASLHPKIGEVEQIHRALACMFVHGKGRLTPVSANKERTVKSMEYKNQTSEETTAAAGLLQGVSKVVSGKGEDDATLLFLKSLRDMIDAFVQLKSGSKEVKVPVSDSLRVVEEPTALQDAMQPQLEQQATVWKEPEKFSKRTEAVYAARKSFVNEEPPQPATESNVKKSTLFAEQDVRQVIVDRIVERTGYPADMLELDLDLEADLGIDTVKQVAILADVRQQFGLEQESGFRVRDYHTLRKIITYFQTRLTEGKKPSFFE